jgi:hypothetical protein
MNKTHKIYVDYELNLQASFHDGESFGSFFLSEKSIRNVALTVPDRDIPTLRFVPSSRSWFYTSCLASRRFRGNETSVQ